MGRKRITLRQKLNALLLCALLLFSGCGTAPVGDTEPTEPQMTVTEAAEATTAEPEPSMPAEPPTEPEAEPPTTEPIDTEPKFVWETAAPEQVGLDAEAIRALYPSYDVNGIQAALIWKDGYLVDAHYADGFDENSLFSLHSCTKSFTSALIGIAIDQGLIEGVDVPLSDYFPEVMDLPDTRWQNITLRHLLTHSSGIGGSEQYYWYDWRSSEDWVAYLFSLPLAFTPGTSFAYGTGNTHLLSAVLEQATGQSWIDYGKAQLFDPMGIENVRMDLDPREGQTAETDCI